VQASLLHTGAYHQAPYMLQYPGQQRQEPSGAAARGFGPTDRLYRAQDGWFYLRAADIAQFDAVEGMGQISTSGDPITALEQAFAMVPASVWIDRLRRAGIPAHVLQTLPATMADARAIDQMFSITRDSSAFGAIRTIGRSFTMSPNPPRILPLAPMPGADSRAVLSAWIGPALTERLFDSGTASDALPPDVMIVW
jgi:crotonobetainyl-CoA:carnitine CoA-transferase CaiB-like acyl-CoA transferase